MSRKAKEKILVGDFETTVMDDTSKQDYTEVWASAVVELNTEDVKIHHSIQETWQYLTSLDCNVRIYYHNLKFDGSFWLDFILHTLQFTQAINKADDKVASGEWIENKYMKNKTFKYMISDMGAWYSMTIKYHNHFIEIRDSLKLLPFKVKEIGEGFKTKHRKLEMEYKGFRYAGCPITDEEKKYIANDVLVVKEALEFMFSQGHDKLTIGSCCLSEFKGVDLYGMYRSNFPDVTQIELDPEMYGASNVDEYVRKSYRGGWCYVVKGKSCKITGNGVTADVNSLYPSVMHSMSGNYYPVGDPVFWKGSEFPDSYKRCIDDKYYFIRVKFRFHLKEGYLPCIQIKNNHIYKSTEWLETSDYYSAKQNKYFRYYVDEMGRTHDTCVTMTLTQTDWQLIRDHYNLDDVEILDGCWFHAMKGLFDDYINKYKKIKMTSKGAMRQLAKLFLNNLYGKLASSTNSSFKVAYLKDDGSIGYYTIVQYDKQAGYIPVGSAITSYARNFTIRAAQANYHGINQRGFIYADTDSIHCDLNPDELVNVPVHASEFCHWKLESYWNSAWFVRQKTYIEHVTHEDGELCEPYYNVKCAGMPEKCKNLYIWSMTGKNPAPDKLTKLTEQDKKFIAVTRTLSDFNTGLSVPGKLMPCRIRGGVLLRDTNYVMHKF